MTPGTLVLLPEPARKVWSGVEVVLREYGWEVLAPQFAQEPGPHYVARAALAIGAAVPRTPILLVAQGAVGPLLASLAAAQRAAHRAIGGYVLVDAEPPLAHGQAVQGRQVPGGQVPGRQAPGLDWPDAPCGYLRVRPAYAEQARIAALRGWPVAAAMTSSDRAVAEALHELIQRL